VSVAGDRETTAAVQGGLIELSERQGVELDWSFRSAIAPKDVLAVDAHDPSLLARVWLDVRGSDRAVLYIADTTHDRFLLRVVPLESGYDEVARESLGNIVESAIDALLAGADFGVSRQALAAQVQEEIGPADSDPPPEAPAREPEEPRAPRRRVEPPSAWLSSALAGYRVEFTRSTALVRHGPELAAILWQRPDRFGPFLGVFAGYRVPSRWLGEGVELRMQGAGGRLWFGYGSPRGVFSWRVGPAAGVEATRVWADVTAADLSAREPTWQVAPALGALAEGELRLYRSWGLGFGAGVETDLLGHHFDVLQGGDPVPILEPWRARPVAWLALGWNRP
jgi:hypothetical protein